MTAITIKQGDLQRPLVLNLQTEAGDPVTNLDQAVSVKIDVRPAGSETKTITARAMTVTDIPTGEVTMAWATNDTATPGLYLAEVLVEWQAGEPQTYPSDGFIEIYIEPDLAETPVRTAARRRVELAAATNRDPVLDPADVAGILDRARRADSQGRAPGDAGWVETYDILDATIEAWEAKAAAAACRTDISRGSLRVSRSQTMEACERMAAMLKKRRNGSAVMTGPNGERDTATVLVGNGPDTIELNTLPGAAGPATTDEWDL